MGHLGNGSVQNLNNVPDLKALNLFFRREFCVLGQFFWETRPRVRIGGQQDRSGAHEDGQVRQTPQIRTGTN